MRRNEQQRGSGSCVQQLSGDGDDEKQLREVSSNFWPAERRSLEGSMRSSMKPPSRCLTVTPHGLGLERALQKLGWDRRTETETAKDTYRTGPTMQPAASGLPARSAVTYRNGRTIESRLLCPGLLRCRAEAEEHKGGCGC